MGRRLDAFKEWVNPAWGVHRTVPPMEGGLRPNDRLERAEELFVRHGLEPDAIATSGGQVYFSAGDTVYVLTSEPHAIAELSGPVTALAEGGGILYAAVEGRGLVTVEPSGQVRQVSADQALDRCVTDIAVRDDGTVLLSVGSQRYLAGEWSSGLLTEDSSGSLVLVRGSHAEVAARGLAWPSGVAWDGDGVIVSLSLVHRMERRRADDLGSPGTVLANNMPVYPGRISAAGDGWWVAAPYTRNRFTELLLDEPEACADMMATIERDQWFVPRLGQGNPWTDPLQIGQIRVLGVVKPWAPARSYGLVFHIDADGRISESHQSRVDGARHGVTGVTTVGGGVIVVARGADAIYRLETKGSVS